MVVLCLFVFDFKIVIVNGFGVIGICCVELVVLGGWGCYLEFFF